MKTGSIAKHEARLVRALDLKSFKQPRLAEAKTNTESAWLRGHNAVRAKLDSFASPSAGTTKAGAPPQVVKSSNNSSAPKWSALTAALDAHPDSTPGGLDATIRKLGYGPGKPKGDAVRYKCGNDKLTMRPFAIATELAIEVVHERGGKKTEGVYFGNVVIPKALWKNLQDRFELEIQRFVNASKAEGTDVLPDDMDELKAFIAAGQTEEKKAKETEQNAQIAAQLDKLTTQVETLAAQGKAPKGIAVYVAGPDGAGKSSTGAIVMDALEAAGYAPRGETFKAPTAAERKQHWLKRFMRGVPNKGEVVFWDRGPAGDSVYGGANDTKTKTMAKEFVGFEKNLADSGVLLVKIELYADRDKQADTFGKRLARKHIAQRLEARLVQRGELTPEKKADLATIAGKIDAADFIAFAKYEAVQDKFMRFVSQTDKNAPWIAVDATKRHAARLDIIDRFSNQLADFADRDAKSKAA